MRYQAEIRQTRKGESEFHLCQAVTSDDIQA